MSPNWLDLESDGRAGDDGAAAVLLHREGRSHRMRSLFRALFASRTSLVNPYLAGD